MPVQLIAALVMFFITVLMAALLFFPVQRFKFKSETTQFYWAGFWTFLALIAAFSGGQEALRMVGTQADAVTSALLRGLTVSFVLFVVFAWARIVLAGSRQVVVKVKTQSKYRPDNSRSL